MKIDNNLKLLNRVKNNLNLEEQSDINTNESRDEQLLKEESPAVKAGAKIIKENGYTLDKEDINNLREFLSGDKKDIPSKLSALKLAIEKEIPLNDKFLSKISINTDISMLDFLEDNEKVKTKANRANDNKTISQNDDLSRMVEKNEKLLKKIFHIIDDNLDDKYIKEEKKASSLSSSERTDFLEDSIEDSLVDRIVEDIRDILSEEDGSTLEIESQKSLGDISTYLQAIDSINEAFSLNQVLEVKITQKLIDLKNDFSDLKKELTVNLYKVSDETNSLSIEDRINLLYESIENLDSKIMKSEMSLYMDLKSEKKLIEISSKLQIAKKHLENGAFKEAESMFKSAKKTLDDLKFEPSIKKAFAIINTDKEELELENINVDKWIKNAMQNYAQSEKSVSSLINYLRKMGMNNEVEHFQDMQRNADQMKQGDFKNLVNLKEILLKMSQDNEGGKANAKTNLILDHIEGGQLKNKILDNKAQQSVEINVPIELSGRIKNVKVFIKSPQKMLKLDWENFDMYFVLHSDKLGEMGIRVKAVQRQLSVKIINDRVQNLSKEDDLNDNFKNELKDLGYSLVKMITEAWNNKEGSLLNKRHIEEVHSEKKSTLPSNDNAKIDIKI